MSRPPKNQKSYIETAKNQKSYVETAKTQKAYAEAAKNQQSNVNTAKKSKIEDRNRQKIEKYVPTPPNIHKMYVETGHGYLSISMDIHPWISIHVYPWRQNT